MLFKGRRLGKYQIEDTLGSGGFGVVHLAFDTMIEKQVAIKVPHRQNLDELDKLKEEGVLIGKLDHTNIVSVLTADVVEDTFFIVMEYVEGETLDNLIAGNALDTPHVLGFSMQACSAIRHAHDQDVLHRDLRPANMLVSRSGVLKVADFGISRVLEQAAHGTTVTGSPAYMAPEQFEGRAVFASDIYSLGVTMYEMLTGELPYEPPKPSDLAQLLQRDLGRPPRERNPAVPPALNDLVMKATAPKLANRHQNAQELLDDLLAAGGEQVAAVVAPVAPAVRPVPVTPAAMPASTPDPRARVTPQPAPSSTARFCWQCQKPLHARSTRCPFCGEAQ